jgi:biotin carboxyl carrier protein
VEYEFVIDDKPVTVKLEKKGGQYEVSYDDECQSADIIRISPHIISVIVDKQSYRIFHAEDKEEKHFYLNGMQFKIKEAAELDADFDSGEERSQEDLLTVKAPMPGKVIKICVSEKEKIRKNQTLVIVEAMKMENEIKSAIEGSVKKICTGPGELVDSDKTLIELEAKESS